MILILILGACATPPEPTVPAPDLPIIQPPRPEDPRESELVRLHLEAMDLRERIGQRFMIFVPRGFGPSTLALLTDVPETPADTDGEAPGPLDEPDTLDAHDVLDSDVSDEPDESDEPDAPDVLDEQEGPDPEDPALAAARDFLHTVDAGNPAGMIVYRWNYEDREDVVRLTDTLQKLAQRTQPGRRLLISADQEGGRVAAFRFPDIVRIPSQAVVARHEDPEFVESLAYVTGRELAAMGLNMNLAPVLDLTPIPDASIIGDRAWGDNPDLASLFAERYVRGMERAGVVSTVKHFPGHGVTRVDSHGRLPIVSYTLEDLRGKELIPFAAAIAADVPVVMTAHILFPRIDPDFPVTISEFFLQDLLRREMGFDGVVISDGLEMGALAANFDLDTTLERAIRSGVDLILLYTRYELLDVIDRVEAMVRDGRVTPEQIDQGVERILRLKYRYGLLEEPGEKDGGTAR